MATLLGKIIADFGTQLATAMAVGATTASLQTATDDDAVALPAGRYFFAIDGDNAQKEHISCTLSGTSLTAISSLSRQGVETSGCVRSHRVGSTVTLTDFAHIKFINDLVVGTTTLNASVPLGYDGTATISTANQLATKAYVDGVAIAGGANASTTVKGISEMSVAPASPTTPIAVGDNDPRVPTQNENDALVGTSGTAVSSSNKLVDAADVSSTAASGKIVRANGTALPALDGSALTNIKLTKIKVDPTGLDTRSSTTEQTLVTASVPAGTLSTNNGVRVRLNITQLGSSGVGTVTLRFKYGSTTVVTITVSPPNSTYDTITVCDFDLLANAATNAQKGFAKFNATHSGVGGANNILTGSGTATEDSTGALNIVVTAQNSVNDASSGLILHSAIVEKII